MKKYHIPFGGLYLYLRSFKIYQYENTTKEILFDFWMVLYHSVYIGLSLGLLLI
jgi:hypothetical protein